MYQAQADFKALEEAGEAKDAEVAELEGVKMILAKFENQDLEAKVSALQKQLHDHKQSSHTAAAAAAMRSAYSALKAKHARLLEQVAKEPKAAPSSCRKRPLPVGVLVPDEKSKKLAARPSNRPLSPKPSSSHRAYVDPEEKTKKLTANLRG